MIGRDVLVLPALDPTTSVGVVTRWLVAEGELVDIGDVVAEVKVGGVETDIVATGGGPMRQLVPTSTPVAAGAVIARLGGDSVAPAAAGTVADVADPVSVGHRLCELVLRPGVTAAQVLSAVNAVVAPRAGVVRAQATAVAVVDYPPLPAGCVVAVAVGAVTERVCVVQAESDGRSIGIRPGVSVGLTYSVPDEAETVARLIAEELQKV